MAKGPWHLFDRQTQAQLPEMELSECLEKIKTKTPDQWSNWLVWREDLPDWTPVLEITDLALALQSDETKKKAPPPPPKIPPRPPIGGSAPSKAQSELAHEPTGAEKRRFPRIPLRLRVIVRNEQLTFRTFTKNISLGGASLEHPIPPGLLTKNCQIYLADPDTAQNIRFKANVLQDRSDFKGIAFKELNGDDEKRIQVWIEKFGAKA